VKYYVVVLQVNDMTDRQEYDNCLPQMNNRERLKKPREDFKEFFGDEPPPCRYKVFTKPIPVRITGSLFYDIDHAPGVVGTGPYKPRTAWEIHPVTKIEFEP